MTEAEWYACTETRPLLDRAWDQTSERKLRLFAAAVARSLGVESLNPACLLALEQAESYADGSGCWDDLRAATTDAYTVWTALQSQHWGRHYDRIPTLTASALTAFLANDDPVRAVAADWAGLHPFNKAATEPLERAAGIVRDLFDYPDRRIGCDPAWLNWRGCLLWSMAEEIYEQRRFEDLPILADALEETGCTESVLLAHLRQAGQHHRGCWALDLLLDREPLARRGLVAVRGKRSPPYLSVRHVSEAIGTDRRQAGGNRFARVWLRVDPWHETDAIVFGVEEPARSRTGREYLVGMLDGVRNYFAIPSRSALNRLRITVTATQEHPVDSSRVAFARATEAALATALAPDHLVEVT
jgi:hypothetical protein